MAATSYVVLLHHVNFLSAYDVTTPFKTNSKAITDSEVHKDAHAKGCLLPLISSQSQFRPGSKFVYSVSMIRDIQYDLCCKVGDGYLISITLHLRVGDAVFIRENAIPRTLICGAHWMWWNSPGSTHLREHSLRTRVYGANMGPIWIRQDPGGHHVGPRNLVIWADTLLRLSFVSWAIPIGHDLSAWQAEIWVGTKLFSK